MSVMLPCEICGHQHYKRPCEECDCPAWAGVRGRRRVPQPNYDVAQAEGVQRTMSARQIEIRHRYTRDVLYRSEDASTVREAVISALEYGANLGYADLWGANLGGADLRYADLRDASLRYASLRDVDLRSADLRGADLRGADLRGAVKLLDGEEDQ